MTEEEFRKNLESIGFKLMDPDFSLKYHFGTSGLYYYVFNDDTAIVIEIADLVDIIDIFLFSSLDNDDGTNEKRLYNYDDAGNFIKGE